MGEKLLAQRLIRLLRDTNGRSSRTALALLDWAFDQRDWLWPDVAFAGVDAGIPAEAGGWQAPAPGDGACSGEPISWARLPELAEAIDTVETEIELFAALAAASDLLALDPFEREVLAAAAALDRLPRLASLRSRLFGCGEEIPALVGRLAGAEAGDAARRVRRSAPVTLGLLFSGGADFGGNGTELGVDWRFSRVLDAGLIDPDELVEALAGIRQTATLTAEDFVDQRVAFDLLVRLLGGALGRARPA